MMRFLLRHIYRLSCSSLHKARSEQKWFPQVSEETVDWSTQSSDLSPVQHLWDEAKR